MDSIDLQCVFPENVSLLVPSQNSLLTFYGPRAMPVCAWEFGVIRSCIRKPEIVEW